MITKLTKLAIIVVMLTASVAWAKKKARNEREAMKDVPMTRPEEVLSIQSVDYGHSVSWVELDDGRILMSSWGKDFRTSDDGGMTWSEPFRGRDKNGDKVDGLVALVRLADGGIGAAGSADVLPRSAGSFFHPRLTVKTTNG